MIGNRNVAARRVFVSVLLLLLVGSGLTGCKKKAAGKGGFAFPPMPVETAPVTRQTVFERFETVGDLDAAESITLVAEIPGIIRSLPFKEGDHVEAGALIAQLDDDQLVAERDRAAALKAQAQASYDRVNQVVEAKAGAPQDLDDAKAALQVAEANLALAAARLSKTQIRAPFSGIVGVRRVSPGAFINPGDPITVLARTEEMRIVFFTPERFLSTLKKGSQVTISTTAYPGYELTGQIDAVDPVLDQATRTTRVVARVKNLDGRLHPGMSANVSAVLSQREGALTIPSEAVFMEGNQPLVFVVKPDSSVTRQALVLGTRMTSTVEVVQGLEENEVVVRAGHQKLFEGAKVMPIPSAPGGPGTPAAGAAGATPAAPGAAGGQGAAPAATAHPDSAGKNWSRAVVPADSTKGGTK
jgi:membrane fusion protein, multidrug efflux system